MQTWLADYMDVNGKGAVDRHDNAGFQQANLDISSYFARRKPARQKKIHLFRFHHSTSSFSFAKEQMDNGRKFQVS